MRYTKEYCVCSDLPNIPHRHSDGRIRKPFKVMMKTHFKYRISKGDVNQKLFELGWQVRVIKLLPFGLRVIEYSLFY